MEVEPGEGWSDAVSKILRMGTNNPESNRFLSKAKMEDHSDNSDSEAVNSDAAADEDDKNSMKEKSKHPEYSTVRLKPKPQPDALQDNDLKAIATRGVVHLFNAVKTVNPKSDKKRKKKKKKSKKGGNLKRRR